MAPLPCGHKRGLCIENGCNACKQCGKCAHVSSSVGLRKRKSTRRTNPQENRYVEAEQHQGLTFEVEPDVVQGLGLVQNLRMVEVRDVDDKYILELFGVHRQDHNLPSRQIRENGEQEISAAQWSSLISMFSKAFDKMVSGFIPGHVDQFWDELFSRKTSAGPNENEPELDTQLMTNLFDCYVMSKKGSVERNVLRALGAGSMSYRNFQKRVARQTALAKLRPEGLERTYAPKTMSFTTARQSSLDLALLRRGKRIPYTRYSRERFTQQAALDAVRFILQPEYIVMLSWGQKTFRLGAGEVIEIPRLIRKITLANLAKAYEKFFPTSGVRKLCVRSFKTIAARITGGQQKALTAVDYTLDELVTSNCKYIHKIITNCIPSVEVKQVVFEELEVLKHFLKVQFSQHVGANDKCIMHQVPHALGEPIEHLGEFHTNCHGCKYVFWFFEHMKEELDKCSDTIEPGHLDQAKEILSDCEEKAFLFQKHRVRVANQSHRIEQLMKAMELECSRERNEMPLRMIIVGDYKMKWLPKEFREATLRHFGKSISITGFLKNFTLKGREESAGTVSVQSIMFGTVKLIKWRVRLSTVIRLWKERTSKVVSL